MKESGSIFLLSCKYDCSKCLSQNFYGQNAEVCEVLSDKLWACLNPRLSLKTQQNSKPLEFWEKFIVKYFDLIVMGITRNSLRIFNI